MSDNSTRERLLDVRRRIEAACQKADKSPEAVTLLAVSKTKPMSQLTEAYQAGQRHFGENYAQEAVEKQQTAAFEAAQWHFIGPLQSNKSRGIAESMDWVHTVDRRKIAQRLNDQRPKNLPPLNVLIQVNISGDPAKSGVSPNEIHALADIIADCPNLSLRGLMTITANGLDEPALRAQFTELKNLQLALIKQHSTCTECSMGMSRDFELAIECGATMVRVGSDIFGQRTPKQ